MKRTVRVVQRSVKDMRLEARWPFRRLSLRFRGRKQAAPLGSDSRMEDTDGCEGC